MSLPGFSDNRGCVPSMSGRLAVTPHLLLHSFFANDRLLATTSGRQPRIPWNDVHVARLPRIATLHQKPTFPCQCPEAGEPGGGVPVFQGLSGVVRRIDGEVGVREKFRRRRPSPSPSDQGVTGRSLVPLISSYRSPHYCSSTRARGTRELPHSELYN